MPRKFYDCVVHPHSEDDCPVRETSENERDCNNCPFLGYIGILGGEFYVECDHPKYQEDNIQ